MRFELERIGAVNQLALSHYEFLLSIFFPIHLSQQRLPGRMVASMDTDMTIQAGTIKGPIVKNSIYRLIRLAGRPRIKLARMPLIGVTALTKIGCLAVQKGCMG